MNSKPDLFCNRQECGWRGSRGEVLWRKNKRYCPKCEADSLEEIRNRTRTRK